MIKYEVFKEKEIECRDIYTYKVCDLYDWAAGRTAEYPELIFQSDSEQEAIDFFEEEKRYCVTRSVLDGSPFSTVLFDLLELVKTEYDEDGEIIQSELIEDFIAEY